MPDAADAVVPSQPGATRDAGTPDGTTIAPQPVGSLTRRMSEESHNTIGSAVPRRRNRRESEPLSSNDDPARRFADFVKLSGLGTRFINKVQERHILEEGVTRFDLSLDDARGVLRSVSEDNNYVFESETGRRIKQVMARHAGRSGKISRAQFERSTEVLRDFCDETISPAEARRRVKQVMNENGWEPRPAGLLRSRRWYRKIEA
jgi:hypothetical protein